MKLRATLERHLKEMGITASALADKAGVPKSTLLGWLAGKAPRDMNQLRAVATFIGTSIGALLFDEEPTVILDPQKLSGFKTDDDGWHRGIVEVRFRHLNGGSNKY